MMLTLTIFYEIPELNVGLLFLMKSDEKTLDPEKVRLQPSQGPKYTQAGVAVFPQVCSPVQQDAEMYNHHQDASKDFTPSPDDDEDMTPVHARP